MAKNRGNKRKLAGKMTRNQQRKRDYATQSGWKHGAKGSRKSKGTVAIVGGSREGRPRHPRPTLCSRACRQCYPNGIFAGAPCRRGQIAA